MAGAAPLASAQETVTEISPIVQTCVDAKGKIAHVNVVRSSGYTEIDEAARKIAWAAKYEPAKTNNKAHKLSCVKFVVKFVIKDGEVVPAES